MLTAMLGQMSILYYYLSENLSGALWIISFNAIVQVGTTLVLASMVGKLTKKFGAKKLMLTGFSMTAVIALIAFLLPTGVYGTLFFFILGTPFLLLPNILIWANVADCIDYNYEISGQRNEGVIYSSYSFMRKVGQAIAALLPVWV